MQRDEIEPFQGLMTTPHACQIPKLNSRTCQNFDVTPQGSLTPLPGYVLESTPFSTFTLFLLNYKKSTGLNYLILSDGADWKYTIGNTVYNYFGYASGTATRSGTALTGVSTAWATNIVAGDQFKYDADTNWININTVTNDTSITLASSAGATSGSYTIRKIMNKTTIPCGCVLEDKLIISDGVRIADYWDGTLMEKIANMPVVRYLTVHKRHVFGAIGSQLYWSDINAPTTWQVINTEKVASKDGGQIIGIKSYANSLVILKDNGKMYQMVGEAPFDASDATYQIITIDTPDGIGVISPRTYTIHKGLLVFQSSTGIYSFDGVSVERISEEIKPTVDRIYTPVVSGSSTPVSTTDVSFTGTFSGTEYNINNGLQLQQDAVLDQFTDTDYTNSPTWTVGAGTWSASTGKLATSKAASIIAGTNIVEDTDAEFNAGTMVDTVSTSNVLQLSLISDNFTDGDYTSNPTWTVGAGSWSVAAGVLTNTNTVSASSNYIYTTSTRAYGTWTFSPTLNSGQGVSTSSTYFISSTSNTATLNGYLFYAQYSGSNIAYGIYRANAGGYYTLKFSGTIASFTTVKITRDSSGNFELFLDNVSKTTFSDNTYTTSSYFICVNGTAPGTVNFTCTWDNIIIAPSSGTFTSQVLDGTANLYSWGTLTLTKTLNGGTVTIGYRTGASNPPTGSFTTISSGDSITGSRYLQYQLTFSLGTTSPTVSAVTITSQVTQTVATPLIHTPSTNAYGKWQADIALTNVTGNGGIADWAFISADASRNSAYLLRLQLLTSTNTIYLVYRNGSGSETTLATFTSPGIVSGTTSTYIVTRSSGGTFEVFKDSVSLGTCIDTTLTTSAKLVLLLNNSDTTTAATSVTFDNFKQSALTGTYISTVKDGGTTLVSWNYITVDSTLNGETYALAYRAEASNPPTGAWTTITSGQTLGVTARYLQYKITPTSATKLGITPYVSLVSINYNTTVQTAISPYIWSDNNRMYVTYGIGGAVNSEQLILDEKGQWLNSTFPIFTVERFNNQLYASDSSSGKIWKLLQGYSANGTALTRIWESKQFEFDVPEITKKLVRLYITCDPSDASVDIGISIDNGAYVYETISLASTGIADNGVRQCTANVAGNTIQFRLRITSADTTFVINKMVMYYDVMELR